LQSQCRIQCAMVCSHKPQETTLKGVLCQNTQVPYFGGLRNREFLTATAWQSYSDLKHVSRNQCNVRTSFYNWLILSQTAEQTPETSSEFQTPCWNDEEVTVQGPRQAKLYELSEAFWSPMLSFLALPASQAVCVKPPLTGCASWKSHSCNNDYEDE